VFRDSRKASWKSEREELRRAVCKRSLTASRIGWKWNRRRKRGRQQGVRDRVENRRRKRKRRRGGGEGDCGSLEEAKLTKVHRGSRDRK